MPRAALILIGALLPALVAGCTFEDVRRTIYESLRGQTDAQRGPSDSPLPSPGFDEYERQRKARTKTED